MTREERVRRPDEEQVVPNPLDVFERTTSTSAFPKRNYSCCSCESYRPLSHLNCGNVETQDWRRRQGDRCRLSNPSRAPWPISAASTSPWLFLQPLTLAHASFPLYINTGREGDDGCSPRDRLI